MVGLIPGPGEAADGINSLVYLGRGDYANATLSAAAMVPFVGWGATGGKLISKGAKYYKSLKLVKVVKKGNQLLKLAKKYGLNANSATTKQLLENFDMKAADWIAKFRKGTINRELGDISNKTIREVFDAADSKMRKLILNGRDKFKK